jgi:hypothetical protein
MIFQTGFPTTSAAEVLRRPRQLLLQLSREDLRAELWLGAGLNPGVFNWEFIRFHWDLLRCFMGISWDFTRMYWGFDRILAGSCQAS